MKYKYSRTFHLPWSQGISDDDKVLKDTSHFEGKEIVVLEKMDGENLTVYSDCSYHARSIDSSSNPWQHDVVSDIIGRMYNDSGCAISPTERMVFENLFAVHSIEYSNLTSYAYLLSVWEGENCLSHDRTIEVSNATGIPVPVELYRGIYNEKLLIEIANSLDTSKVEGYVVRTVEGFHIDDFCKSVSKFVRKGHVQTDEHWTRNWKQAKLGT